MNLRSKQDSVAMKTFELSLNCRQTCFNRRSLFNPEWSHVTNLKCSLVIMHVLSAIALWSSMTSERANRSYDRFRRGENILCSFWVWSVSGSTWARISELSAAGPLTRGWHHWIVRSEIEEKGGQLSAGNHCVVESILWNFFLCQKRFKHDWNKRRYDILFLWWNLYSLGECIIDRVSWSGVWEAPTILYSSRSLNGSKPMFPFRTGPYAHLGC